MSLCSSALWELVAPGKSGKRQESSGIETTWKKRKTEADLAMDQACAEAIARYNHKVLTVSQLQETKDRIQERRVSHDVQK